MFVRMVSGAAVLILSIVPVFGQSATAEFNGSVVDQSGAVLPGAAITIAEESTGLVRTAVSSDTGRFVIPAVQPGVYTVRAELSGFQTQSRTGVRILVGQAVTLKVSMTIDAFAEYNVMTHDYGAEYGGASGVIVNAVTKSGTNRFRGSGYYYGQDDRFNATNYFSKLRG